MRRISANQVHRRSHRDAPHKPLPLLLEKKTTTTGLSVGSISRGASAHICTSDWGVVRQCRQLDSLFIHFDSFTCWTTPAPTTANMPKCPKCNKEVYFGKNHLFYSVFKLYCISWLHTQEQFFFFLLQQETEMKQWGDMKWSNTWSSHGLIVISSVKYLLVWSIFGGLQKLHLTSCFTLNCI